MGVDEGFYSSSQLLLCVADLQSELEPPQLPVYAVQAKHGRIPCQHALYEIATPSCHFKYSTKYKVGRFICFFSPLGSFISVSHKYQLCNREMKTDTPLIKHAQRGVWSVDCGRLRIRQI